MLLLLLLLTVWRAVGGTGFEQADFLQCCKFAEGDSRILMLKMARDRLRVAQKSGPVGGAQTEEDELCAAIEASLAVRAATAATAVTTAVTAAAAAAAARVALNPTTTPFATAEWNTPWTYRLDATADACIAPQEGATFDDEWQQLYALAGMTMSRVSADVMARAEAAAP